jgi:hypothetical protein
LKLAALFCGTGFLNEAENAVALLLKREPAHRQGLDEILLMLANAWDKQGNKNKKLTCLQALCKYYPHSRATLQAGQQMSYESTPSSRAADI